jgi:hypothetical protein
MARTVIALAALLSLSACQSDQSAVSTSMAVQQTTRILATELPETLADSCTTEMPAALPRESEPWVTLVNRWLVLRENRNDQAASCAAWWRDYRTSLRRQYTKDGGQAP